MQQSTNPANRPVKSPSAAFEVIGTAAAATPGGQRKQSADKPAARMKKQAGQRPRFIEPLESRTILG